MRPKSDFKTLRWMENVIFILESPSFCDFLALFGELCVETTLCIIFIEEIILVVSSLYTRRWEHSGFVLTVWLALQWALWTFNLHHAGQLVYQLFRDWLSSVLLQKKWNCPRDKHNSFPLRLLLFLIFRLLMPFDIIEKLIIFPRNSKKGKKLDTNRKKWKVLSTPAHACVGFIPTNKSLIDMWRCDVYENLAEMSNVTFTVWSICSKCLSLHFSIYLVILPTSLC